MNELKVVKQQDVLGKDFKIYGDFENPLFLAKDVAEWIDYEGRSGQLLSTIDENEKLMHTIYASGQNRDMWFLTEDGLYEVLMQSRKPIAKAFKKEVKTILKSVRKNGGYIANQENLTPEQIVANALVVAQNIIEKQKKQLTEQKPLVEFAETVSRSVNSISIGDFAKLVADQEIKIGQNKLFQWLRNNKYLNERNIPYQKYVKCGYFDLIEQTYKTPYGEKTSLKTLVTGKGQIYFVEKLRKLY